MTVGEFMAAAHRAGTALADTVFSGRPWETGRTIEREFDAWMGRQGLSTISGQSRARLRSEYDRGFNAELRKEERRLSAPSAARKSVAAPRRPQAPLSPLSSRPSSSRPSSERYMGVRVFETDDPDLPYSTSLDPDSRFETLSDAHRFIKAHLGKENPMKRKRKGLVSRAARAARSAAHTATGAISRGVRGGLQLYDEATGIPSRIAHKMLERANPDSAPGKFTVKVGSHYESADTYAQARERARILSATLNYIGFVYSGDRLVESFDARPGHSPRANNPPRGDADRYDSLYREIEAARRDPLYRSHTHEGMEFRDRVIDMERELETYKSAALARAQEEIDAEREKRERVESARLPSQQRQPVNRLTADAADLAADYKSRGMSRQRAWSQFVIDRGLRPGMDAKDFYAVYDRVSAFPMARYRNPAPAADALYESFHGKPADEIVEVHEEFYHHDHLSTLGVLVELTVVTAQGYEATIATSSADDDYDEAEAKDPIYLASSEDGRQLYFTGGDQALDLDALKIPPEWKKDDMIVGVLTNLVYRTRKKFDNFKLTDYTHKTGEDSGYEPLLRYDPNTPHLYVTGGSYHIEQPLLEMSPGIED
jgi:hypothetical protein